MTFSFFTWERGIVMKEPMKAFHSLKLQCKCCKWWEVDAVGATSDCGWWWWWWMLWVVMMVVGE